MRADEDKLILEHYKISNTGSSLIPKKGLFGVDRNLKRELGIVRTEKLPAGVLREESSIFKMLYNDVKGNQAFYETYQEVIREMHLEFLCYNQKFYYLVNRDIKRQIKTLVNKQIANE